MSTRIKSGHLLLTADGQGPITMEDMSRVAEQAIALGVPADAEVSSVSVTMQFAHDGVRGADLSIHWRAV